MYNDNVIIKVMSDILYTNDYIFDESFKTFLGNGKRTIFEILQRVVRGGGGDRIHKSRQACQVSKLSVNERVG